MVDVPVYVRSCRSCGSVDTHSLFGRPEMVDESDAWRCRICPSTAWCLARLSAEPGGRP